MYLNKIGVGKETKVNVNFEKVVDDLLMISIINEPQNDNVLSYWRLTKVQGIPPLEIGINSKNNYLASITFYIDSTYIVEHDRVNVIVEEGNVLVDSSIFTHINEYIDIYHNYSVQIQNDRLVCFFENVSTPMQAYRNNRLEVYIDAERKIIGFAICDLTDEQMDMINSL